MVFLNPTVLLGRDALRGCSARMARFDGLLKACGILKGR